MSPASDQPQTTRPDPTGPGTQHQGATATVAMALEAQRPELAQTPTQNPRVRQALDDLPAWLRPLTEALVPYLLTMGEQEFWDLLDQPFAGNIPIQNVIVGASLREHAAIKASLSKLAARMASQREEQRRVAELAWQTAIGKALELALLAI